jgi:metal-sulfur cluster biosynthetic enzyme
MFCNSRRINLTFHHCVMLSQELDSVERVIKDNQILKRTKLTQDFSVLSRILRHCLR